MNAASQLFRALAIIGAIAAGVLFYLTNGKTAELTGQLAKAKSAATAATTDAGKTVEDLQAKLTTAAVEKEKAQRDTKAATDRESLATERFVQAKAALDATEPQIKELNAKNSVLSKQNDELNAKVTTIPDLTSRLATQASQIEQQAAELKDLREAASKQPIKSGTGSSSAPRTVSAPTPVAPPTPVQLSSASPAKVLQVDMKNGILVLDVGTENGIQKDAQLYIKVGDSPVGVVVVSDSKAKMATCTITSIPINSQDFAAIVRAGLPITYQRAL